MHGLSFEGKPMAEEGAMAAHHDASKAFSFFDAEGYQR